MIQIIIINDGRKERLTKKFLVKHSIAIFVKEKNATIFSIMANSPIIVVRYYRACFEKNLVSGKHLILMDASALPKIGITDFQHIKVIAKGQLNLIYYSVVGITQCLCNCAFDLCISQIKLYE